MPHSVLLVIFLSFQGFLASLVDENSLYPYPKGEEEYMYHRDLTKKAEEEFEKRTFNLSQVVRMIYIELQLLRKRNPCFGRQRSTFGPLYDSKLPLLELKQNNSSFEIIYFFVSLKKKILKLRKNILQWLRNYKLYFNSFIAIKLKKKLECT